jgi:hypothetical protein
MTKIDDLVFIADDAVVSIRERRNTSEDAVSKVC